MMPSFKKYTGNYIEIINHLNLPSAFYKSISECNLIKTDDSDTSFSEISELLDHKNGIMFHQGTLFYVDQESQSIKAIVEDLVSPEIQDEAKDEDEEWLILDDPKAKIIVQPNHQDINRK